MIRLFIGYDRRETVAFHVAAFSALRRCSEPISITGLVLGQLPEMTRTQDGSTQFTYSRFLVPHLCRFQGLAVFMDCDVLVRADLAELVAMVHDHAAVACVKHAYVPSSQMKFLGNRQVPYERKNWSSVMVFNCAACRTLTSDYVDRAKGMDLHQFRWTRDDAIQALPVEWNHLVGEYGRNPGAKIAHFTLGTPCFPGYEDQEFADEWRAERDLMLAHG